MPERKITLKDSYPAPTRLVPGWQYDPSALIDAGLAEREVLLSDYDVQDLTTKVEHTRELIGRLTDQLFRAGVLTPEAVVEIAEISCELEDQ